MSCLTTALLSRVLTADRWFRWAALGVVSVCGWAGPLELAQANDCPDTSRFDSSREIIEDLGRIVAPSGIEEAYTVEAGDIPQWLNIRGQDRDNPVILFVHGGPAAPVTPSLWQFQRPLEEYFTVVNWDQRGSGRTYGEADPEEVRETLKIARYVEDAIAIAEHVVERLEQDRIILMGHSWGSIIGMRAAMKRPDLFHAYVGIGQVINIRENERLSYEYAVAQARDDGNEAALEALDSIAPYPGEAPLTRERIGVARQWAQHYGGLSAFRENSDYFFRAPLLSPDYSDSDRCAIGAGSLLTLERVLDEFLEVDFSDVRTFPVPVVFFLGRHDYTTPSAPAASWLNAVNAPYARAVWFERSSHMVPWEEPGRMLVSLLEYVRPLTQRAPAEHPGD